MNRTAVRGFAVHARTALLHAVTQRAFAYGITETGRNDPAQTQAHGCTFTPEEQAQRGELIAQIRQNGFAQTMEEAACTWFSRFIALRYMEVNGFLPSRVRVFTDGSCPPELLTEALHPELTDGQGRSLPDCGKLLTLPDSQDNEALYRYLLLATCRVLHGLPLFEETGGWTALLLPDDLLHPDSVPCRMVRDIPEADWRGQVQITGFLYQYYNEEPKNRIFSDLKRNIKIDAKHIPAATQLFTPDWIVRYLVENSLGRLWAEGHGKPETACWDCCLEEAGQEPSVCAALESYRAGRCRIMPEDIRFLDPCMGSGHMLVYAFDVLMDIYTSCGWTERDAARAILRHNLYGLDIDRRAYQLCCFALLMKARQYDRQIFRAGIRLHLANFADAVQIPPDSLPEELRELAAQLRDADSYGSLLELPPAAEPDGTAPDMLRRIVQILSKQYDVVCTNPPYMGSAGMEPKLLNFVREHYPDSKSDLSTCFMERCAAFCKPDGYYAMINIPVWMFLSSYETLRRRLLSGQTVLSMLHLGRGVFGSDFGTAAFVIARRHIPRYRAVYRRLFEKPGAVESPERKRERFLAGEGAYTAQQEQFAQLPGSPLAYWVSGQLLRAFAAPRLGELAAPRQGLATGCNARFLRLWHEVSRQKLLLDAHSRSEALVSGKKWFPYNKGGMFRRWYGNQDYVVNWEQDGREIRSLRGGKRLRSRPQNMQYYFRESLSWSLVSSGQAAFRYKPCGQIFDIAGMSCFSDGLLYYLLGLTNTPVVTALLEVLSPTINYQAGDIAAIPVIVDAEQKPQIEALVQDCIAQSRADCDSFEVSWDFLSHPLV